MTEAGIGRILVASLHQAIADLLPMRLEFYENWLHPEGLRHGTIGLAPLHAVLSFLRQEGSAYHDICRRAGEYTAEWTVASQWPPSRSMTRSMPLWLRSRAVLRLARGTLKRTYVGTKVDVRLRRGEATVDVRASLFCTVRDSSSEPLCGFYASAVARFLALYSVPADVRLGACRAAGDPVCRIGVALGRPAAPPALGLDSRA
jgi:bacteriochlorophyll 4-vinyl reductase